MVKGEWRIIGAGYLDINNILITNLFPKVFYHNSYGSFTLAVSKISYWEFFII